MSESELYDAYMGHLLRAIFLKQPGLIASSQRTLTFTELVEMDSLDDARRVIIDAEIGGSEALAGLIGEVAQIRGVTEARVIADIKTRRGA